MRLLRSPTAAVGVMIVLIVLVCAIGGVHLAPFDPDEQDILARLLAPSLSESMAASRIDAAISRVFSIPKCAG